MIEKLTNLIKYDAESVLLDFKKEEYELGKNPKKYDLLKDILAFVNHPSNDEKFIIIGIKEKDGFAEAFFSIESITD